MSVQIIINNIDKILLLVCTLIFSSLTSYAYNNKDKPLFVSITSDSCYACKMLEPTLKELKQQYHGNVQFLELDISSEKSLYLSEQLAYSYGIDNFFSSNKNAVPNIGIFCPRDSVPSNHIVGAHMRHEYSQILNDILLNSNNICQSSQAQPYRFNQIIEEPDKNSVKKKYVNAVANELKKNSLLVKSEAVNAARNYIRVEEVRFLEKLFKR